jgi:hypothetical protein
MLITGVFCVVVVVIAILLSRAGPGIDVPPEVAKGLISLAVALLITGALSYILSERSRMQADRAEQERLLVSALQELKSAHEKVQIVQFWLSSGPRLIAALNSVTLPGAVVAGVKNLTISEKPVTQPRSPCPVLRRFI